MILHRLISYTLHYSYTVITLFVSLILNLFTLLTFSLVFTSLPFYNNDSSDFILSLQLDRLSTDKITPLRGQLWHVVDYHSYSFITLIICYTMWGLLVARECDVCK